MFFRRKNIVKILSEFYSLIVPTEQTKENSLVPQETTAKSSDNSQIKPPEESVGSRGEIQTAGTNNEKIAGATPEVRSGGPNAQARDIIPPIPMVQAPDEKTQSSGTPIIKTSKKFDLW